MGMGKAKYLSQCQLIQEDIHSDPERWNFLSSKVP